MFPPGNIHIPDGAAPDPERECAEYERAIARSGGVELFVVGAGSNGHIAFNEPGSPFTGRTRIVALTPETIAANSRFFDGDPARVPRSAITVGIGTILEARFILLLAAGRSKARALRMTLEEKACDTNPVSCLQLHPRVVVLCDTDAASEFDPATLKRFAEGERERGDPGRQG
jgi:glucosamine-6-phosphate deaminase